MCVSGIDFSISFLRFVLLDFRNVLFCFSFDYLTVIVIIFRVIYLFLPNKKALKHYIQYIKYKHY